MSFSFPLGFIALVGVPILILIYIIKSKYTEQTIASTYIWDLSEKFLKRRKPVSKITGIINLIIQLLAVIFAAVLIAHPVFTIPASANDFYFVLDGSASMNMQSNGSTRFDRAKEEIYKIIDKSRKGSTYSLVFASDTTDVVFEGINDKEQAKTTVKELTAGWTDADCSSAIVDAQNYFDGNNSSEIYLITDKDYYTSNITLIDVSSGENNFSFTSYDYTRSGGSVLASGEVMSYGKDTTVTVELSVGTNGSSKPITKIGEVTFPVIQGEPSYFEISATTEAFGSLQLKIVDADALDEDNVVILYDEAKTQARKVLMVNETKDVTYLKNAIEIAGGALVEVVDGATYERGLEETYGMYVFNGYAPKTLPKNAAIWLVNAIDGACAETDVSFGDYEEPRNEGDYYTPDYATGTTAQEKMFMKGVPTFEEVAIRKYAKYHVRDKFTTIMSVQNKESNSTDPVIAAGLNKNNDRQVVFAFELGDTEYGATMSFVILVKNLMNYSFPTVIDDTTYVCGDIMNVNVVPNCENIVVNSPSGKSVTLDTQGKDICAYQLTETGTYTIRVRMKGNEQETVLYSYATVPEAESGAAEAGVFMLSGIKENEYSDGYYDDVLAFLIIIAVLLLADWGVYCYEQYQLR